MNENPEQHGRISYLKDLIALQVLYPLFTSSIGHITLRRLGVCYFGLRQLQQKKKKIRLECRRGAYFKKTGFNSFRNPESDLFKLIYLLDLNVLTVSVACNFLSIRYSTSGWRRRRALYRPAQFFPVCWCSSIFYVFINIFFVLYGNNARWLRGCLGAHKTQRGASELMSIPTQQRSATRHWCLLLRNSQDFIVE